MEYYKEYKQQRKVAIKKFNVGDTFSYCLNVLLNKINIDKYFEWYEQLIIREILWGKGIIILKKVARFQCHWSHFLANSNS